MFLLKKLNWRFVIMGYKYNLLDLYHKELCGIPMTKDEKEELRQRKEKYKNGLLNNCRKEKVIVCA
jgi:hypothetical protein